MSEVLEKIDKAGHIVVVSHINPDADSLGSASAMYSFLLQKHKKVSWFCKTSDINLKFSCIPWFEKIRDSFPSHVDLVISLDCADDRRMGIDIGCYVINIDHHESNNYFANLNIVDSSAISTTEVVYNFFKKNSIKINKKMATALYAGVLDDSDSFLSPQVNGTTFALICQLIEDGADFHLCNKNIMKTMSLAALRLKAGMLKNMSLECSARVAVFCVSDEDMKSSGARGEDCEAAVEELLYLPHVEAAVLLKQNSDFTLKGSIRSNSKVDCAKVALSFGGGGHKNRAGFVTSDKVSFEDLKDKVLNLLKKEM